MRTDGLLEKPKHSSSLLLTYMFFFLLQLLVHKSIMFCQSHFVMSVINDIKVVILSSPHVHGCGDKYRRQNENINMSHELGSIQYTKIGVLPSQELTSKIEGTRLVAIFNHNGVF